MQAFSGKSCLTKVMQRQNPDANICAPISWMLGNLGVLRAWKCQWTPPDTFSTVVKHATLRETSCKSRRSPFPLLSLLPWPSLAVQRKKKPLKPLLPKLLLLKLLRLPKLLPLKLLLLLKKPLLLLKPLPLKLLRHTNQPLTGLMQKGVPWHPFFIGFNH